MSRVFYFGLLFAAFCTHATVVRSAEIEGVKIDDKVVQGSGGPELALELEEHGYEAVAA